MLTRSETRSFLQELHGTQRLVVAVLYGSGLRLMEALQVRVKDVDLGYSQILIRDGKGRKDRLTVLPSRLKEPLRKHLGRVRLRHQQDLASGLGSVELPTALDRKLPGASRDRAWQWVFQATRHYRDPAEGERRRHHLHESAIQRAQGVGVRSPVDSL